MVGMIKKENKKYEKWRKVFGIIDGKYEGGEII
jgi:hypothetical protein